MPLDGTTDDLLGERVFFSLSVLVVLFVKIHIHLIDWLVLMLAALAQNSQTLSLKLYEIICSIFRRKSASL